VSATTDAPIYAQLVHERGDVVEQARHAAEQTWRDVGQTVNFHLPARDDDAERLRQPGPRRRQP
jgi:hypothetical protein